MNVNRIWIITFAGLLGTVKGQQSLESSYRTTGSAVVAAFEAQRQVLQHSSAVILDGRKETGYGVVISPDGYILTKASELPKSGGLAVTVDQTHYQEVKVLAEDLVWDVVLLKIESKGLIPVDYAPTSDVLQGTWVVANGATSRTTRRLLAGIVSAKSREIPASGGAALGVILKVKSEMPQVEAVQHKSGAEEAGLQKDDVILSIDGKKIEKVTELNDALKDGKAGNLVHLLLRRKGEEVSVDVRLAARAELYTDQVDRNDQMSGDFSPRRSGFPRVLQHDILGSRTVQGGPLLDLDGRCIGMNIARANRSESFAIPVEELKGLAESLMKQAMP